MKIINFNFFIEKKKLKATNYYPKYRYLNTLVMIFLDTYLKTYFNCIISLQLKTLKVSQIKNHSPFL
jgi:hypothetical protein